MKKLGGFLLRKVELTRRITSVTIKQEEEEKGRNVAKKTCRTFLGAERRLMSSFSTNTTIDDE